MTSTKVTQAAGLFMDAVGAGTISNVSTTVDSSFSQVMDRTKQDLGNDASGAKQEAQTVAKTPVKVERSIKETSDKQTEHTSKTEQEAVATDSHQAETDEATEEILTEAVEEIAETVKEELDLTDEELEAIMETLGFTQMDLLRPENMQAIVMAAAGEADQMSILTDENLYQSLQMLTDAVETTVTDVQQQLGVETTAFENVLKQMEVSAEPEVLETAVLSETDAPVVIVEETQDAKSVQIEEEVEVTEDIPQAGKIVEEDLMETPETKQTTELTEEIATTEGQTSREGTGKERNSSGMGSEAGKENFTNNNPFVQVVSAPGTDAWSMEALQSRMEIPFHEADVENIMRQVTEYMRIETGAELTEMELQLQPETLGTVRIHLTAKEGAVTAQFTAETEAVKAVLEAQAMQLKENLSNQGVKVEAVEVTIANQGFNKSYAENGENAAGYEEPKKKNVRKIQLTDEVSLDEMELSEEDRITAEMMEMNGNTVDYTA